MRRRILVDLIKLVDFILPAYHRDALELAVITTELGMGRAARYILLLLARQCAQTVQGEALWICDVSAKEGGKRSTVVVERISVRPIEEHLHGDFVSLLCQFISQSQSVSLLLSVFI